MRVGSRWRVRKSACRQWRACWSLCVGCCVCMSWRYGRRPCWRWRLCIGMCGCIRTGRSMRMCVRRCICSNWNRRRCDASIYLPCVYCYRGGAIHLPANFNRVIATSILHVIIAEDEREAFLCVTIGSCSICLGAGNVPLSYRIAICSVEL